MGFLKKITRPISRVLDKIVPNEIKPALPFLAAAAPFMAPGIMGIGGNTMLSRALISGGLNLGSQLAQEGSEGDFSPLSVALASGIGALSAPNAASTIRGVDPNFVGPRPAPEGILGQGKEFLAKSAEFLGPQSGGAVDILGKGGTKAGFDMATAKAASVPFTQATMDLGIAEARRTAKDLADEALNSLPEGASDADRALAIRQFMEAAGYFSEDEIVDTITAAGYADGGRVGLSNGGEPGIMGNPAVMEKIENMREFMIMNPDIEDITDYGEKYKSKDPDFEGIKGAVISVDENMRADRAGDFFRLREEAIQKGDDDKIKEIESDFFKEFGMVMPKMAKDGGRINLREGGVLSQILPQPGFAMQLPTLGGFQPLRRAEAVFPRLNELEQGVNIAENKLSSIRDRLGNEQNPLLSAGMTLQRPLGLQQPINMNSLLRSPLSPLQQAEGMKDGGLMDLGGKEMDLRKGGFVPIGKKERADDVPARLSKNEFVMTADAVRGAGGGDINKGAKRMYETMNRLEARA